MSSAELERLKTQYQIASWVYDILDYPWERQYRRWRPLILKDVKGRVLEAGVGTGQNLQHYSSDVDLVAIDLSEGMLRKAKTRAAKAKCKVTFQQGDASCLSAEPLSFASDSFDEYISTFMYCVMPDSLQSQALREMARVLKPGGKFKLVEIVYSKNRWNRMGQRLMAPFVQSVYGARFDHKTLLKVREIEDLDVTKVFYLKGDTYLLIEGRKI